MAANNQGDKLHPRYLSMKDTAKRQRLLASVNRGNVPNEPIPGEQILTIGVFDGTNQFNIKER